MLSSNTVNEHWITFFVLFGPNTYKSPKWTLPNIRLEPTPTAIPANLVSSKCIMLHFSAQSLLIIVLYAPESTNAYTEWPLTFVSMYNIVT